MKYTPPIPQFLLTNLLPFMPLRKLTDYTTKWQHHYNMIVEGEFPHSSTQAVCKKLRKVYIYEKLGFSEFYVFYMFLKSLNNLPFNISVSLRYELTLFLLGITSTSDRVVLVHIIIEQILKFSGFHNIASIWKLYRNWSCQWINVLWIFHKFQSKLYLFQQRVTVRTWGGRSFHFYQAVWKKCVGEWPSI